MAEEKQPPGVVEGATTGDVEDEMLDDKAKSAEDRKAAAALSKLDARDDDVAGSASVDQEGLSKAMNKLSVAKTADKTALNKVKVDAADVALLVSWKPPQVHARHTKLHAGQRVVRLMMLLHRLMNSICRKSRLQNC